MMGSARVAVGELCADKARFVSVLGGIYESSAWVAERAWSLGEAGGGFVSFESVTSVAKAMRGVVEDASDEEKMSLLRSHPDLAGRAALRGDVGAESLKEQSRAGLDSLTPSELSRFESLNGQYRSKFGWPFILAVKNATKQTILGAFARRIDNDRASEFAECLAQVHKIAWMRLLDTLVHAPTGKLTCHVLDTATGSPAAGMAIELETPTGETLYFVTNADGRLDGGPALAAERFTPGTYEWRFFVSDYFAAIGAKTPARPFLTVVPIRFAVDNPEDHYHVPLLCSPWSFSTYRGS